MSNRKYGHIPDPINKPYIPFERSKISSIQASDSNDVDLRPFSLSRHNQLNTSSCVAQSSTKALLIKNAEKYGVENTIPLSALDLYWNCRNIMQPQQTQIDEGTNICLAMDALRIYGICRESEWPFNPTKVNVSPSVMTVREEFLNKIDEHYKIDSTGNQLIDDIVLNLQNKNPVVFGMNVGDEFEGYNSSSPPLSKCTNIKGSHATTIIGWIGGKLVCENSWGFYWGHDGFYFIEPELISSIGSDFWVIKNSLDIYWEK